MKVEERRTEGSECEVRMQRAETDPGSLSLSRSALTGWHAGQDGVRDSNPKGKKDGLQEGKIRLKLNTGKEKGVYSFLR